MKNPSDFSGRQGEIAETAKGSTLPVDNEISGKKAYTSPTLKRYTSPKLRKHQSYKDITMLFAVIPPIPPTSP